MKVEQHCLEPYRVTWAAYHDGNLVEPLVKASIASADDIFSSLKPFLMDIAEEKYFD